MDRILIADGLDRGGLDLLRQHAEVMELTAADRPRLAEIIGGFDALVVRSATQVDAALLRAGKRLRVVGRAGIGVDNIDVPTATELGILVVNSPTGNLMAATEHAFALMLTLARRTAAADASMKAGKWDKKSFVGVELQGKTLGIIGFGRIGQRVARRARGFEMKVVAYDPFLDAAAARRFEVELLPLEELLRRSDVLTFHTPLTPETKNLLDAERIALMPKGAMVVNCGRGGVIDEPALLAALESGHLGGAALDVWAEEPTKYTALVQHPKVVATPHLGASTEEAQARIALETADSLLAALQGSLAVPAVNLPFRSGGAREPFLRLAEGLGRLGSALAGGGLQQVRVDLWGIEDGAQAPLGVAVLKGALSTFLGGSVNYVNAEHIAHGRGIEVVRSAHTQRSDFAHLVGVTIVGQNGRVELAGALFGDSDPRIVSFSGYRLEFRPEGKLLVLENRDVPGVVGRLGTLLGKAGINIADIHLARHESGEYAMAVLRLDQEPSAEVKRQLAELPEVRRVQWVDLGAERPRPESLPVAEETEAVVPAVQG